MTDPILPDGVDVVEEDGKVVSVTINAPTAWVFVNQDEENGN